MVAHFFQRRWLGLHTLTWGMTALMIGAIWRTQLYTQSWVFFQARRLYGWPLMYADSLGYLSSLNNPVVLHDINYSWDLLSYCLGCWTVMVLAVVFVMEKFSLRTRLQFTLPGLLRLITWCAILLSLYSWEHAYRVRKDWRGGDPSNLTKLSSWHHGPLWSPTLGKREDPFNCPSSNHVPPSRDERLTNALAIYPPIFYQPSKHSIGNPTFPYPFAGWGESIYIAAMFLFSAFCLLETGAYLVLRLSGFVWRKFQKPLLFEMPAD